MSFIQRVFLFTMICVLAFGPTACAPAQVLATTTGVTVSTETTSLLIAAGLSAAPEVLLMTVTAAGASASFEASIEEAASCADNGGILITLPIDPSTNMGGTICDMSHILNDGAEGRPQNRKDALKKLFEDKPEQYKCMIRADKSVLLLFDIVFTSTQHPARSPYIGAGIIYNPNVTENNLTVMNYRSSPEKEISDIKNGRFTAAQEGDGNRCTQAFNILKNSVNYLSSVEKWAGDLWK